MQEVTTSAYSNLVEENEKLQGDVTVAENAAIVELQQEKTVAERLRNYNKKTTHFVLNLGHCRMP